MVKKILLLQLFLLAFVTIFVENNKNSAKTDLVKQLGHDSFKLIKNRLADNKNISSLLSEIEIDVKISMGDMPLAIVIKNYQTNEFRIIYSKNNIWHKISNSMLIDSINKGIDSLSLETLRLNILKLNSNNQKVDLYLLYVENRPQSFITKLLIFFILIFTINVILLIFLWRNDLSDRLDHLRKILLKIEEEKQKSLSKEVAILQEKLHEKDLYIQNHFNQMVSQVETTNIFLNNAAHEIKIPLKSIISLIHTFHSFKLTPLQNKYLDVIEHSTIILVQVMNGLLTTSSILNDKKNRIISNDDIQNEIFEIDSLFNNIIDLFLPLFHMKQIDFIFEINALVPRIVKGNRSKITQMIICVLDFCYEYGVVSRSLKAEVGFVNNSISLKLEACIVYGKDLTVKNLEKDLYLVYRYVKKMNAKFSIEEKGKNKNLHLLMPIIPMPIEESDWFQFIVKRKKVIEKKVLYLDDQSSQSKIIRSYLDYFKITYDYFDDIWMGENILQQRSGDYHVVIINSNLKQKSCLELITMLKKNSKFENIDFWPMIDIDELDYLVQIKDLGIKTVITKPISREVVFHSIGEKYYGLTHDNFNKAMRKVLLIDDTMEEYRILALYLKSLPIDLKICHGVESASTLMISNQFDLIITGTEIDITEMEKKAPLLEIRNIETESIFQDEKIVHQINKKKSFVVRPIEKNKFIYHVKKLLFHVK